MYSLGPIPKAKSGKIIGAHQKIDRIARHHLCELTEKTVEFPGIQEILHFEGVNGPDGIKLKSPGRDEPWHFVDPEHPDDQLLIYIRWHMANLTEAIVTQNEVRAAFEAAWLAHAVTDGLTPAHHEPFEAEMEKIRGENMSSRNSIKNKVVMPRNGSTKQFIKNNWEFWGAGGMMTSHMLFEAGVSSTIKLLKFEKSKPSADDLIRIKKEGFEVLFLEALRDIDHLQMYQLFQKTGWTRGLAQLTRNQLVPTIIRIVILAWYASYIAAVDKQKNKS